MVHGSTDARRSSVDESSQRRNSQFGDLRRPSQVGNDSPERRRRSSLLIADNSPERRKSQLGDGNPRRKSQGPVGFHAIEAAREKRNAFQAVGEAITDFNAFATRKVVDNAPAAEWSFGAPQTLAPGVSLDQLQVLSLSSSRLNADSLGTILGGTPLLHKLDISRCGLVHLPPGRVWSKLKHISILLMHRNSITQWMDLDHLKDAAKLEWLTVYENPVAGQQHFRIYAIQRLPQLLALDYWVISDPERVMPQEGLACMKSASQHGGHVQKAAPVVECRNAAAAAMYVAPILGNLGQSGTRFLATSPQSILPFAVDKRHVPTGPSLLVRDFEKQSEVVRSRARYCSASSAIQAAWKSYRARTLIENDHEHRTKVIIGLQRRARAFLWNKQMVGYLKGYLGEIDQLDLILSAREMLMLRAKKRIEAMVRLWVQRRKNRSQLRNAAILLSRVAKGFFERELLIVRHLELHSCLRIIVPERFSWEFLVLVNVARRARRLPPLPRGYKFEPSDLVAIRVPEVSDLPQRKSLLARLLSMRNSFVVRPVRSNRYPQHLWDGLPHKLTVEAAAPRIQRGREKLKRRLAHVTMIDRRAFLESCVPGVHPITRPVVPKRPSLTDKHGKLLEGFRELYGLGALIGTGTHGLVFECHRRHARPQTASQRESLAVKLVEHKGTWWFDLPAPAAARWRLLAAEVAVWRDLQHQHIAPLQDLFVGEYFLYAVTERYECNIKVAMRASLQLGQRAIAPHILGEMATQMLRALAFVHEKTLVHRNIKPENFCVDMPNFKGRFNIVLVDIIHARRAEPGVLLTEPAGSRNFWAPEVVAKSYAHPADVWALGATIWSLVAFSLPFASLEEALSREITKDARMTEEQFEWLERMLRKDPQERCTAAEALRTPDLIASEEQYRSLTTRDRSPTGRTPEAGAAEAEAAEVADAGADGAAADVLTATIASLGTDEGAQHSRRMDLIRRSGENYAQGLELYLPFEDMLAAIEDEVQEPVQAATHEWWAPELQFERRTSGALRKKSTHAGGRKAEIDGGRCSGSAILQTGDIVALDVLSTTALTAALPQADRASFEEMQRLRQELAQRSCRLAFRNSTALRVVDVVTLRIQSPSGRFLVCTGAKPAQKQATAIRGRRVTMASNLKPGAVSPSKAGRRSSLPMVGEVSLKEPEAIVAGWPNDTPVCFPTIVCKASGSGRPALRTDVRRLIGEHMCMPPDSFHVRFEGGVVEVETLDVDNDEVTAALADWSAAYSGLGLRDLCRRRILDGVVRRGLSADRLLRLGLPAEGAFERRTPEGLMIQWDWWDADECRAHGLPLEVLPDTEGAEVFSGFRPVDRLVLNRTDLPKVLSSHGVDLQYFGVGEARTLRQFLDEAMWGEARLYVHPEGPKEVRRYIESVTLTVRSSSGAVLMSSTHDLKAPEKDREPSTFALPQATILPFEDEVWAVRRLLHELQIPHGEAHVHFGNRRAEPFLDPRYPGITSMRLEQEVEVILGELDIGCIEEKDLGAYRWFEGIDPDEPPEGDDVELQLRELLEGPERNWDFMLEAQLLGSRPRAPPRAPQGPERAKVKTSSGTMNLKNYRSSVWLSEPLVSYECDCARTASTLIQIMLNFPGLGGYAPLVNRVPFLAEASAREVSAVVIIQATFRAHRERLKLACAPGSAAVLRRATLCIQQMWRWSITRRRLRLLKGALQAIRSVRTTTLYVEERLLAAINLINSVNRYAPMLRESLLGFGYSEDRGCAVLVRADDVYYRGTGGSSRRITRRGSGLSPGKDRAMSQERFRERALSSGSSGTFDSRCDDVRVPDSSRLLPAWLLSAMQELPVVNADECTFKSVAGLQGLLLEGLGTQMGEEHTVSIPIPSLQHAGRVAEAGEGGEGVHGALTAGSPALAACGGVLRFVELKFPSIEVAQQRALLLYLCTFSAAHCVAVPLLSRSMLQSVEIGEEVLRLWDIYGLVWPAGDRTSTYQIRKRYGRAMDIVQANGRESWASIRNQRWCDGGGGNSGTAAAEAPRSRLGSGASLRPPTASTPTATPTSHAAAVTPTPPAIARSATAAPVRRLSGSLAAGSAIAAVRSTSARPKRG
eukprot:TRINITY_DN8804_c0_g1_i2.p1 TRINITY_DN8804_c0_g1~~TRINITY_DN8804_c0_g1_i2.p1  ORF type:complete len:2078 (+),score=388.66 TRINITY_DN8804_c0_g1_i2:140-6373(+)